MAILEQYLMSGFMSADEAAGYTVSSLLFLKRIPQARLAEAMDMTSVNTGRKLHGAVGWTLDDLAKAAEFLGVQLVDVIPTPMPDGTWVPADPIRTLRAQRELNPQPSDP